MRNTSQLDRTRAGRNVNVFGSGCIGSRRVRSSLGKCKIGMVAPLDLKRMNGDGMQPYVDGFEFLWEDESDGSVSSSFEQSSKES